MKTKKLLIIPVVLMALMMFSAFAVPQAHAAPTNSQILSGATIAHNSLQRAKPQSCGWADEGEHDNGLMNLILWEYTCDGGYHVQLIAHAYGTFTAELLDSGGYSVQSSSGWLNPGQSLNTPTDHHRAPYSAYGIYGG